MLFPSVLISGGGWKIQQTKLSREAENKRWVTFFYLGPNGLN